MNNDLELLKKKRDKLKKISKIMIIIPFILIIIDILVFCLARAISCKIVETTDKPMIYLYPEEETNVKIRLLNEQYLTTTYPKYKDSWNVIAKPDGTIIDPKTNRQYYGLYWEGVSENKKVKDEGFVIEGKDTASFLEEKLSILGLNEKEANEFIIYWLPKMEHNKYNYIRFETMDEINKYMPLEITPYPDTVIRIIMEFKPLDKKINVKEQKLNSPKRNGFVLVEWGGTQLK